MKRKGKTLLIVFVGYLGVAIALIAYQKHREDVNNFGMSFNEERQKLGLALLSEDWKANSYEDYEDTLATNVSWTASYDIDKVDEKDSSNYQELNIINIQHIDGNRISETDTYVCKKDSIIYTLRVSYFFKPKVKGVLWESSLDIANLNQQKRLFEQEHKAWEDRQNQTNTNANEDEEASSDTNSTAEEEEDHEPELDSVYEGEYTQYTAFMSTKAKASADSTLKAWKGIKKKNEIF